MPCSTEPGGDTQQIVYSPRLEAYEQNLRGMLAPLFIMMKVTVPAELDKLGPEAHQRLSRTTAFGARQVCEHLCEAIKNYMDKTSELLGIPQTGDHD